MLTSGVLRRVISMLSKEDRLNRRALTLDRIGRIETILYSLVEQQKAGPIGSVGMLNDIARDVKQLQTMANGSAPVETTDQVEAPLQRFASPSEQPRFSPLQSLGTEDHPVIPARRYTMGETGVSPDVHAQAQVKSSLSRQPAKIDHQNSPREFQRRRLHPP